MLSIREKLPSLASSFRALHVFRAASFLQRGEAETELHSVAQAGLQLLILLPPPESGITGVPSCLTSVLKRSAHSLVSQFSRCATQAQVIRLKHSS